jgi:hypothetical protein
MPTEEEHLWHQRGRERLEQSGEQRPIEVGIHIEQD